MKILILYTRLTGYWFSCMKYDHQKTGNEYLVIRKSPSLEAPFSINAEKGIELIDGDRLSSQELGKIAAQFLPDTVYLSGWADSRFKKLAKHFKGQGTPVIMGMDNHWLGNIKQLAASIFGYLLVRRYCTHIWIPGAPQLRFAQKLGFADSKILRGLYCADETLFSKIQQVHFKAQITFVGRLVDHKGLEVLFDVLNELISDNSMDFEVKIIGNGLLSKMIPKHEKIKHLAFIHPLELPNELENAGFFILPSHYEAWGVVVHEAVLAGLPVIATYQTGAATEFIANGKNGFTYGSRDKVALKNILSTIGTLSEQDYSAMSRKSKELSKSINLHSWSATLNSVH